MVQYVFDFSLWIFCHLFILQMYHSSDLLCSWTCFLLFLVFIVFEKNFDQIAFCKVHFMFALDYFSGANCLFFKSFLKKSDKISNCFFRIREIKFAQS